MRQLLCFALFVTMLRPDLRGGAPAEARLVRIDAVATDSVGRVVKDLRPVDFEVVEGGEARTIDSVRFVSADGSLSAGEQAVSIESSEVERKEAAREGTRLFALFLDEYHVSPGSAERVRTMLTEFVERRLGARDLVLIVKPLDSLPGMRLTRNRGAILKAIAGFEGRKGDYTPRTAFEREYIAPNPERIDTVRAQIAASALTAMSQHLGALQTGRKTIIAMTEGFAKPVRRRGDAGLPSLDVVTRSANRSGVSIYPIDPRVLVPSGTPPGSPQGSPQGSIDPTDSDQATLQSLASETGGEAIVASSQVPTAIERIVSDASGYYLVSFAPASTDEGGRFRPVSVKVTRPSVVLRTRPGYREPFPDPMLAVARAEAAAPVVLRTHASPLIRSWFGFTRGEDGKTVVQYVWEPAVRVPGDRTRAGLPVRTVLTALDRRGNVIVEDVVSPSTPVTGAGGAPRFAVDPGIVQLRIRIEDASQKLLDEDVRQLAVSPLSGPIAFGTAQVFRARNAREFRELTANPSAVPVVARDFSRTDRLLIRMPVYSNPSPFVTATIASPRGGVMRSVDVQDGPGGVEWRIIDLPLASLASGDYQLSIVAESGDRLAQSTLAFRVTP